MPPRHAQYAFLDNIFIGLFDDLPSDSAAFENFEQDLAEFLIKADKAESDSNHPFYLLRECLRDPISKFPKLNTLGPAISVGTIQRYLIEKVTGFLTTTGNPLKHWNGEKILAILESQLKSANLICEKGYISIVDDRWSLPTLSGQIYTRSLEVIPEEFDTITSNNEVVRHYNANIFVIVKTTLDEQKDDTVTDRELIGSTPAIYPSSRVEKDRIEEIKANAEHRARTIALGHAITEDWRVKNETARLYFNPGFYLLLNRAYFQLLINDNLCIDDFRHLTLPAIKILKNPNIIVLIKENICTFAAAQTFKPTDLVIINQPVYFAHLLNKKLNLPDVLGISSARSKFMIHPQVIFLFQSGRLVFSQLKTIALHLAPIFYSPIYLDYFASNPIDWHIYDALTPAQAKFIALREIAILITSRAIDYIDAINVVNNNPCFQIWLNADLLPLEGINNLNRESIVEIYSRVFAQRLYKIFNNEPYRFDNCFDNYLTLANQIFICAPGIHVYAPQFYEMTLNNLYRLLEKDLQAFLYPNVPSNRDIKLCQDLLGVINNRSYPRTYLLTPINSIIEAYKRLELSDYTTPGINRSTLFSQTNLAISTAISSPMNTFCIKLNNLTTLTTTWENLLKNYAFQLSRYLHG